MALKTVLQSQRVHNRGEHADVVGLCTIHAISAASDAAEDVAAAYGDGNLNAVVNDLFDLLGKVVDDLRIDSVSGIAHQGLAGELQQHTMIFITFSWHVGSSHRIAILIYITIPSPPSLARTPYFRKFPATKRAACEKTAPKEERPKGSCIAKNARLA